MGGKYGVKDTKEVLKVLEVSMVAVLKEISKDGFQMTDLGAFLKSPEFEAALGPALDGIANVPAEAGELDLFDDLELAKALYNTVIEIMAALKK